MQLELTTPYGYCQCGCGQRTTIPWRTDRNAGRVKGVPMPYIKNHNRTKWPHWVVEDHGYKTPCWVWQLAKINGYGRITLGGRTGSGRYAHVVEWEKVNGPVPIGLELDHLCRIRACVNPEHLEAVTHAENVRRGLVSKFTVEELVQIAHTPRDEAMERFGCSYGYWYYLNAKYGR